jgi:hypothetical protein
VILSMVDLPPELRELFFFPPPLFELALAITNPPVARLMRKAVHSRNGSANLS